MRSINLKLPPETVDRIDAYVAARNKLRPDGHPTWTRTSYMVAAALQVGEALDSAREVGGAATADGVRTLGPVAPYLEGGRAS